MAEHLGIDLPEGPGQQQQQEYQTLKRRFGQPFDRLFTKRESQDHKQALLTYYHRADGQSQVAEYARQALPILKRHAMTASALAAATASPWPEPR